MATARKAKPARATETLTKKAAPRRKLAAAAVEKPAEPAAKSAPDDKEIELLAYKLWEERGRPEGTGDQDWARAVQMLKA
jgi:hypothetical protein